MSAFRKLGAGRIIAIEPGCKCGMPGCQRVRIVFLGGARDGSKRWVCSRTLKPQVRSS